MKKKNPRGFGKHSTELLRKSISVYSDLFFQKPSTILRLMHYNSTRQIEKTLYYYNEQVGEILKYQLFSLVSSVTILHEKEYRNEAQSVYI